MASGRPPLLHNFSDPLKPREGEMLQRSDRHDEGITLIEVMVALLVFAIIASGIIAAGSTISSMATDARARATAANLAAQDIDVVRAIADPFQVANAKTDIPVSGRTYTVRRLVSWTSSAGADISCGSSTNLFYLRVNVRVTWAGQLGSTAAVQDDTILAPATRISDTSLGSIGISVVGVDGSTPQSGVSVNIAPASGGTGKALTTQPKATGADGCTYANQVAPGQYTVAINKNGWIDNNQDTTPVKTVTVTAGGTQSLTFQYDQAATFTTKYVPGPVAYSATTASMPSSMTTSVTSTSGIVPVSSSVVSLQLHPFPSGYSAYAGVVGSGSSACPALDPRQWSAGTGLASGSITPAAAAPGGTATMSIAMGVVLVRAPSGTYIGTRNASSRSGDPGCGTTSTYTYPTASNGGWMALLVPFGSWKVYYGTNANNPTQVTSANLQVVSNAVAGGVANDGTVTLDPRPAR